MSSTVSPQKYRQTLGQYPTGVAVVTAMSPDGHPVGMTVGSFTSVSLDPPLVAFLPSKSSVSWSELRSAGARFCVNILSAAQEDVCRSIATRKEEKFHDIDYSLSAEGNPIIAGAVATIDCTIESIHDAGDHDIVVGRVVDMDVLSAGYPLLFFRGGYGSFRPKTLAAGDADLLGQLKVIDLARPQLDALAFRLSTEVTATILVGEELVLAAASGRVTNTDLPTRVGARVPFAPPMGSVYAAWGDEAMRERWFANLGWRGTPEEVEDLREVPDRVRRRGYAILLGHELAAELELVSALPGDPEVRSTRLRTLLRQVAGCYNPRDIDGGDDYELRSIAVPVFAPDGEIAFILTLWGPPRVVSRGTVDLFIDEALATADGCSRSIAAGSEH